MFPCHHYDSRAQMNLVLASIGAVAFTAALFRFSHFLLKTFSVQSIQIVGIVLFCGSLIALYISGYINENQRKPNKQSKVMETANSFIITVLLVCLMLPMIVGILGNQ